MLFRITLRTEKTVLNPVDVAVSVLAVTLQQRSKVDGSAISKHRYFARLYWH
jgi:hypothetical protein